MFGRVLNTTAQKMKFFIKDFYIFCAVYTSRVKNNCYWSLEKFIFFCYEIKKDGNQTIS